ncbi:MAG: hypothetical protein KAG96_05415 [Ichthyobacteriaceae bacterium]|nr:hypothetical protein [Ichthyobacteriaceae bacterium]
MKYNLLIVVLILFVNIGNSQNSQQNLNNEFYLTITNLDSLRQNMVLSRIQVQKELKSNKLSNRAEAVNAFESIKKLEQNIHLFLSSNTSVTDNNLNKKELDPQLYLSRMIYVKATIWISEQSLVKRVNELYRITKNSENINETNDIIKLSKLTKNITQLLYKASLFDKIKFKVNNKLVILNWNKTLDYLKYLNKKQEFSDKEYIRRYGFMLSDITSMIILLNQFNQSSVNT